VPSMNANVLCLPAVACAAALVAAVPADASERLADDARRATLKVGGQGRALVEYTTPRGVRRHVLAWGAVNARPPSQSVRQVRFRLDFSGGWKSTGRAVWRGWKNSCRPYDGPELAYLVAACKAPDGSYWALQSWQRRLPLLGFDPWLDVQDNWELHLSHWSGELPVLEVHTNWTYGHRSQGVFGRLSYRGVPVHGFRNAGDGNPRDRYGRNVYLDTFNSAYGPGWKRESGILTHRGTGTFCHSFVPQTPFAGYPSRQLRPAAPGERYRATVMGPGVTPVTRWEGPGLPSYDPANPSHVRREAEANATFDRIMAGDPVCRRER
jgi:hypothetical protein